MVQDGITSPAGTAKRAKLCTGRRITAGVAPILLVTLGR